MMIREETFWKKRSTVLWLKIGDRNTTFFHRSTSIHKSRDTIDNIKYDNNVKLTKNEEIGNWVTDY